MSGPERWTCVLCGQTDAGVRMALIRWREYERGQAFGAGGRCQDVAACIERCRANGDEWPVDDGTGARRDPPPVAATDGPGPPAGGETRYRVSGDAIGRPEPDNGLQSEGPAAVTALPTSDQREASPDGWF